MNKTDIPEVKTLNWSVKDNVVIIDMLTDKVLLNESASIVWNMINGVDSIGEIFDKLKLKYGDQNSDESLSEILESSINLFIDNNVLALKSHSDFDGWLQYE
ncbi:MAG TPA: PqqD family peptide modification chaperone [Pseudobacteroides sp.]|uniref:PqqD family peptide modification chaperone n=1 Tax=Pseudobacteroides sp. TaxID=1968840 RepID=UPI002F925CAB